VSKDIVVNINGTDLKYFDEAEFLLKKNKGQKVNITVKRGNENVVLPINISDQGKIGVGVGGFKLADLEKMGYFKLADKSYSFTESISAGTDKTFSTFTGYIKQLKKIFNFNTGAYKGVGGFKAIMDVFPPTWSWEVFWGITAYLSIMLGVMNLLPIPALDGGHVVFTLWEMITGKKPGDKFLEYAQMIGFVLLLTLLLFANGNDIYKAFK